MSNGIHSVLMQLAEAAVTRDEDEKQAFIPMPGGQVAPPPMDPSMDPAMAGAPMDPAMAGAPMDPAAAGMDPMAMAAMGQDPAAIMAAQGVPVDPMMAQAGGAVGGMGAPAEAAPAEAAPAEAPKKGGGQKEKIDEIHNMLTKILGVLVGKGLLAPTELGGILGEDEAPEEAPAAAPQDAGVPAEQKVASMGSVVEEDDQLTVSKKQASEVKNALASLILSLGG
jgi:hypothetical protein